ncbi:CgeB family protein [Stutzerimonas stutzeri]|uniref:CgeB family protein n=1 Tax=Stutzerimonas stutzeri TaxID=316 RepID=UPI0024B81806|nr:glycosyltransferase [Stutzerimonas stutzeri]MDI9728292.1 glycosyltransferase [Stutzerimonas stutzeri]MDI9749132.1 glycosyltransferase [Stutzerimonas stutzeri]
MKILYIGASNKSSTSRHRADALTRLGHDVKIADPYLHFKKHLTSKILSRAHYNTGYRLLNNKIKRWTNNLIEPKETIDIVWVDSGELLGPSSVQLLAQNGRKVILYNHDDPTGRRDGRRFDSLINSIPFYDLCVVVRHQNIAEFYEKGASKVIKVWRSYDEIAHTPFKDKSGIDPNFFSDIAFIGTWMRHESRDKFILQLINSGLNVKIWGSRWNKSPHWHQLKNHIAGGPLSGRDYVSAIQGSKVCLGMLSKGNRDLHTTRTMEIPYAGGVLCAERTSEHEELFEDGLEAVFWENVDECIEKCKDLLKNDTWRESIRTSGMKKIRALKLGHEDICQSIIQEIHTLQ